MRRKREAESSLELLLDTMCNTFGGVMFISIMLVVVITGHQAATQVKPKEENSRIESVEDIKRQIVALEIALEKSKNDSESLKKISSVIENDKRLKLLGEIAVLEKKLQAVELEHKVQEQKNKAIDTEKTSLIIELRKLKKQIAELSKIQEELNRKLADEEKKIKDLKEKIRKTTPLELTFHSLKEAQQTPYFIIMTGNKVWRVGLERVGDDWTANDDVIQNRSGDSFSFRVKPERGVTVIGANGAVTPEFIAFLDSIDKTKVPKFAVDKSANANFYKLRQWLKKNGIVHGFSLYKEIKDFAIIITTGVKYEY